MSGTLQKVDLKQAVVSGLAVLSWIFIVAGLASPTFQLDLGGVSFQTTLFESCAGSFCSHSTGCASLDSTLKGGAAFGVMSILLLSGICAIFIGRMIKPAFFDRPQMPLVIWVSSGVLEFMLLIAWACAFGSRTTEYCGAKKSDLFNSGACGPLLLIGSMIYGGAIAAEKFMPDKKPSDQYQAVGHVEVSSGGDVANTQQQSGYANVTNDTAGYADVSGAQ